MFNGKIYSSGKKPYKGTVQEALDYESKLQNLQDLRDANILENSSEIQRIESEIALRDAAEHKLNEQALERSTDNSGKLVVEKLKRIRPKLASQIELQKVLEYKPKPDISSTILKARTAISEGKHKKAITIANQAKTYAANPEIQEAIDVAQKGLAKELNIYPTTGTPKKIQDFDKAELIKLLNEKNGYVPNYVTRIIKEIDSTNKDLKLYELGVKLNNEKMYTTEKELEQTANDILEYTTDYYTKFDGKQMGEIGRLYEATVDMKKDLLDIIGAKKTGGISKHIRNIVENLSEKNINNVISELDKKQKRSVKEQRVLDYLRPKIGSGIEIIPLVVKNDSEVFNKIELWIRELAAGNTGVVNSISAAVDYLAKSRKAPKSYVAKINKLLYDI